MQESSGTAQALRCTVAARSHHGDMSSAVTSQVMEEFEAELCTRVGELDVPQLNSSQLAARIAAHITVGPAMTLLRTNNVTPQTLFQPRFIIVVGSPPPGGPTDPIVRVITYAYMGSPVKGDRPDRKHTPFVLKMVTSNLYLDDAADEVRFSVKRSNTERMDDAVLEDTGALRDAVMTGGWDTFSQPYP